MYLLCVVLEAIDIGFKLFCSRCPHLKIGFLTLVSMVPLRMNNLEEINRELETKVKKLEEEILNVVEYNNRLKSELRELKREERLTLTWLTAYSIRDPGSPQAGIM